MRKSWAFAEYQAETLLQLLETALELSGEGSAALVAMDGKPLHVRALHPADTATLPNAAVLCQQYLQLKDGDVALLNDPFAGGTRLSDLTLVTGVAFEAGDGKSGGGCDTLLARRLPFDPRVSVEGKIDDEGLRIPPMPLVAQGRTNVEILAAIAAAPSAPSNLADAISSALAGLERARAYLKACGKDPHGELRKTNFKKYLDTSRDAVNHWVAKLPLGETSVSARLETGEWLKLRLEIRDDKVIFDFTGTESSSRVQLTDLATFGACFRAIEAALGRKLPANAGSFQHVQVLAPARTWVNAKPPAATSRGVSDGLATIATLIAKAFGQLSTAHRAAGSGHAASRLRFDFGDGRSFSDATPGGAGARSEAAGLDGWSVWLDGEARALSVERAERLYPLQIRSVVLRPGSGGKGRWAGGAGVVKSYLVLESAKLSWALEQASAKPEGADGGKAGMAAELTIVRSGTAKSEELPSMGRLDLSPGDLVHLHTPGGGGFGEPEPAPIG